MTSGLALKFGDLLAETGLFLGYGRGSIHGYSDTTWTTQQLAAIESCVKSGLRQFYFPAPIPAIGGSYDWSFLRPVKSITLASGATTANLPDDFGSPEGQVSVSTSGGGAFAILDFGGVGTVYQKELQFPDSTGQPQCLCVEPIKGTSHYEGQRHRLHVWPTSDQAYTLTFQYYVDPEYLSTTHPHPYGGLAHAETIRAACLMAAEEFLDDARGVWAAKFQERLAASINMDRRNKAQNLGQNRDRSDAARPYGRLRGWDTITFNGTEYE